MLILEIFGFLNISFMDIVDILTVSALIYLIFHWIKESVALNIFLSILFLFFLRVVVVALNMKLMSAIMGTFIDLGVLALIIIFQPEVRHFLIRIGNNYGIAKNSRSFINRILGVHETQMTSETVKELASACKMMSDNKTGALIVIPHKTSLDHIIETGDRIDALINRRIVMNIFFKNSPLHDGAMVMTGDRIIAARCTLPITKRSDIPANYGMRHKAAIGITEETDADVIVISEETGNVSHITEGQITPIESMNELMIVLVTSFNAKANEDKE